MKKTDALAQFGQPGTPQAARVSACAEALKISRAAIYMWPDDDEGDIPELRALQIEKIVAERAAAQVPRREGERRSAA